MCKCTNRMWSANSFFYNSVWKVWWSGKCSFHLCSVHISNSVSVKTISHISASINHCSRTVTSFHFYHFFILFITPVKVAVFTSPLPSSSFPVRVLPVLLLVSPLPHPHCKTWRRNPSERSGAQGRARTTAAHSSSRIPPVQRRWQWIRHTRHVHLLPFPAISLIYFVILLLFFAKRFFRDSSSSRVGFTLFLHSLRVPLVLFHRVVTFFQKKKWFLGIKKWAYVVK